MSSEDGRLEGCKRWGSLSTRFTLLPWTLFNESLTHGGSGGTYPLIITDGHLIQEDV